MRIALDATYSVDRHPSGIAVYSNELLDGLTGSHPEDRFLYCYRWKQWRGASPPPYSNSERRLLLPPLSRFRAEVFHALNQRVDVRPAKRVLVTFHDLFVLTAEYSSPEFRKRFRQQAERAARNADVIVAVSRFTATQVEQLLGVPASRIRVIPHGIHPPNEPPPDAQAREHIVLFVGALQTRKNVARLVRAFAALPSEWRLVLAGSPRGYGASEVMESIERSPARSRIEKRGYASRDELIELYRRSAIFAFPSLDEGFGIPILEAMSFGLPVLTSNRSAMPEVAGGAALLVDPLDETELSDALIRLANDCSLRQEMFRQGRERAEEFSWQRTCELTYSLYKEVI